MSFLRIGALWLLPLILVPLLIHLAHRRRQPTVRWPAMMFLHRANPSKRGPAKLKRWLVLAFRMAVVAALVLALARPLSSGLFGVAASRVADEVTTVILLDRSPSMQRRLDGGKTRQVAGLEHLSATLETVSAQRIVVIESVSGQPIEIAAAESLLDDRFLRPADSSADIQAMMAVACDYLREQQLRSADIWVCSDGQALDWKPEDSRWGSVAESLGALGDSVRLFLCRFPMQGPVNHSVRVTGMTPDSVAGQGRGQRLLIDVRREDGGDGTVPVSVTVGEVTESVTVDLSQGRGESNELVLPQRGDDALFGKVSIPADLNRSDDEFYFAADTSPRLRLALVTSRPCVSLDVVSELFGKVVYSETIPAGNIGERLVSGEIDWDSLDALIWQGPLPAGTDARSVLQYLQNGGTVLFFAPEQQIQVSNSASNQFAGIRWGSATDAIDNLGRFDEWEFPVGACRPIEGELVRRSVMTVPTDPQGDSEGIETAERDADTAREWTLVGQLREGAGTAWFCGVDVTDPGSPFVADGLVLYALMSEALNSRLIDEELMEGAAAGTEIAFRFAKGGRDSLFALSGSDSPWRIAEWGHHAGVFERRETEESRGPLLAINQPVGEFDSSLLDARQLKELMPGKEWTEVEIGTRDQSRGLVRELWILFWLMMIVGMLLEGWFSLPPRPRGAT